MPFPSWAKSWFRAAWTPDHYLVDPSRHVVLERKPTGDVPVLSDSELINLAQVGDQVERQFGEPQDIEFALDANRSLWLVQTRPITTVYPLPGRDGGDSNTLRVYFSANVFQGYFQPLTPMGIQFFRLLGAAVYRAFGARVTDPVAGPPELVEAGMRLFLDITPVVSDRLGRRIFTSILRAGEARSSVVLSQLRADTRLPDSRRSAAHTLLLIIRALLHVGVPQA